VTEEPEQVLPQDRVTAALRVEEARAEVWSNSSMTAPAISGPTEAMNRMLAMQIIHTTIGTSVHFMPGARAFIAVTMKLMPPMRKATNSSATASSHSDEPSGVRL
jgi:hypothetical protein